MRVTAIVKATLHSVNRHILRCILIVFYISDQISTSRNIWLCCDSPYCIPCIFKRHVFSSSMQIFEDLYQKDFVLDPNESRYCQKVKSSNFMNTLPVLKCQFFKTNHFHTLKSILFHNSRSNNNSEFKNHNYCVE